MAKLRVDQFGRPSVTTVLGDLGVSPRYQGEAAVAAANRGTRVHEALACLSRREKGLADVLSAAPDLQDRIRTGWGYLFDYSTGTVLAEKWLASPIEGGFHGTPDLVHLDKDGHRILVDFKTGAEQKYFQQQLAAYRHLVELGTGESVDRCRIVFITESDYRIREFSEEDMDEGWRDWCALLRCWHRGLVPRIN